jgi:hypothetical protein
MADTPAKSAPDPQKRYRVKLARAVELAPRVWARPRDEVTIQGDLISGYGDAIISYEEV